MQPSHTQETTPFSSTSRPTYKSIVAQIEEMKVRALAPTEYEDVVTLIDYIRTEALKLHHANNQASMALAEREKNVTKRERDVAMRSKVLEVAVKVAPAKRSYFGG